MSMDHTEQMQLVCSRFSSLAQQLNEASKLMDGWLPAWLAVEIVCNVEWEALSHGMKSLVGAWLRDQFQADYRFEMTPIRLYPKASGFGSQMLAVYPPVWLASKREGLLLVMGEMPTRDVTSGQRWLPFEGEADCD